MSTVYDPAATNGVEKDLNFPVSRFSVVTEAKATAFTTLIQPLFPVQLSTGINPGPPLWPYTWPEGDPDDRRVWCFYSEDGSVQAHDIGPLIALMFKYGDGHGEWAMVSKVEVGGRTPGRKFPPTLTWVPESINAKAPAPVPVTQVSVTVEQAQLLRG